VHENVLKFGPRTIVERPKDSGFDKLDGILGLVCAC
jgi:hypothetical protein